MLHITFFRFLTCLRCQVSAKSALKNQSDFNISKNMHSIPSIAGGQWLGVKTAKVLGQVVLLKRTGAAAK